MSCFEILISMCGMIMGPWVLWSAQVPHQVVWMFKSNRVE